MYKKRNQSAKKLTKKSQYNMNIPLKLISQNKRIKYKGINMNIPERPLSQNKGAKSK